jgi:hypothetical protein
VANTGRAWLQLAVGVVLWATTQMEQEALSVLFGWLWVDSATAVHNIKDRQSQVSHREVNRIRSCIGLDSFQLISVVSPTQCPASYYGNGLVATASRRLSDGVKQKRIHLLCLTRKTAIKISQTRKRMSEPTYEELKAKLSQLEKEVEVKKRSGDLIFKVGEKGGVSVYGLGRFPVTLYYEQWNRLLGAAEDIKKFLEDNKSRLKLKEQG